MLERIPVFKENTQLFSFSSPWVSSFQFLKKKSLAVFQPVLSCLRVDPIFKGLHRPRKQIGCNFISYSKKAGKMKV